MRFFDATTRKFALWIGIPAFLVLLPTFAVVIFSIATMADQVNRTESVLNGKSASAAIQSTLRRFGESHGDYAQWDDAVRNLYGTANPQWATENIATSALFDTFFLIGENGEDLLGYQNGKPTAVTPQEAFGPSLEAMIAALPKDGATYDVKTGIVRGASGLASVAVGPVVPATADFPDPPQQSRYLVIGKAFDAAAVQRLSEDFVIAGLRLVDASAAGPLNIDLTDPNGTIVGALAWSPGSLGTQAHDSVVPVVLIMLLLVGVVVAFLVVFAFRGWSEVEKRELRLNTALNNMVLGLCMFDPDGRLVTTNRRFAEIFHIPPGKVVHGLLLDEVMALTQGVGSDPAQAVEGSIVTGPASGGAVITLADGRVVAIVYRPMANGGFVLTFEDVSERRRAEARIQHLAHHDALTDLPNRMSFYERMESVTNASRGSQSMAVLSIDLDHFKSVNDTLGHPVGDLLLKVAAERMRRCVRSDDMVARLGGDEFAVLQIPSEQAADVTSLAARLIEAVEAPYDLEGHEVVVGVSIGIAVAPGDGADPDTLMKGADLALYRAKADGGSSYRFFEAEMDARMQARRALELDLRRAVVKGEFELYYQPVIDVKTGQITTCEALIRWHDPERGLVEPVEFIGIAEETGLIVQIGEWVLLQACREAARWPKNVTVAVNVSPVQFKSRNLLPAVIGALDKSGLAASRLELEITELVLLHESDGAIAILQQFHDLGVRVAMDDFGTGYSSLGSLRSFPFDRIKIDQSFIRDMSTKGNDSVAIIRAVVGLSSSLGIKTTAEGVETEEQLARLKSEGCDQVQGFLFSPPRPAADVERLLGQRALRATAVA